MSRPASECRRCSVVLVVVSAVLSVVVTVLLRPDAVVGIPVQSRSVCQACVFMCTDVEPESVSML